KWHLDGLHSVGMGGGPILANHTHNPSAFGFSYWLSSFGVFDVDPVLSRNGALEDFVGDSSDVIVAQALAWMRAQVASSKPALTVIWYPSPHEPWIALPEDRAVAAGFFKSRYYGEMVGLDRSIGALRKGIREMGMENNTLLWFNSDNGGYHGLPIPANGLLRGYKKDPFEGGIRVSAVVEWVNVIAPERISWYPASIYDIFPTVVELLGLPQSSMMRPYEGTSLARLFARDIRRRHKPIFIAYKHRWILIDNEIKYVSAGDGRSHWLYNLSRVPQPKGGSVKQRNHSLAIAAIMGNEEDMDEVYKKVHNGILKGRKYGYPFTPLNGTNEESVFRHVQWLFEQMAAFMASVNASKSGADYPDGMVKEGPGVHIWLYQAIDRASVNFNRTHSRSRFEKLGGYLKISG
ncbi:MAG: hypothetical protein SGPRY_009549, partial [Prymnesium sp.]